MVNNVFLSTLDRRYVSGVGITYWKWLRRTTQRDDAPHVVLHMTRKRLLGWLQTVRGYSVNSTFL